MPGGATWHELGTAEVVPAPGVTLILPDVPDVEIADADVDVDVDVGVGVGGAASSGPQWLPQSGGTRILPESGDGQQWPAPTSDAAVAVPPAVAVMAPPVPIVVAPATGRTQWLPDPTDAGADADSGGGVAGGGVAGSGTTPLPAWASPVTELLADSGGAEPLPPAAPEPRAPTTVPSPKTPPRIPPIPIHVEPAADLPMPAPATRIGQYEIIRELGAGGMGSVFLARDDRLGRLVAIKFLRTGNPELTRRFLVEARATARCSHENIVVIHEVGEHQGSPFMVLEYLQGQTLASVVRKSAPMPPTRTVELVASVVRALVCAHEQGIVHRDLKPENIVLTDAGTIKVLDFGIAKVLQDEPRTRRVQGELAAAKELVAGGAAGPVAPAARTGILGTMAYMSPEQWEVGGKVDHRTDVWATGIMLFQMLTGRHPLDSVGPNPFQWVAELDRPMPSLREVAPNVPPELADLVDRCLRKRKSERLPDARLLLRELEPLLPGRSAPRPLHTDTSPYAGLRSFQEEDADRFFGRAREIAAMVTRIRDWPLMAAVGPSGIGKSSFVRAGIVPALKSSGESWEALVVRPGRDPISALASLVAPLVASSPKLADDLGEQKRLVAQLVAEPGYLGSALRGSARRSGQRLLVFVDQFEELYTLCPDPAARRAFTACLAAAADDATSPVRVLVSIRSDFLGRVAEDPHFMNELAKGLFFLGPPTSEGLRDAIVQPAEMAGFRFETSVIIDDMLEYLEATPGALPLLQFTASKLWEARDRGNRMLTARSYGELGGIAGALVSHADLVISKLAPDAQTLARALFMRLVTPERTRAVRSLSELLEIAGEKRELERLVDQLVESRLLVVQTGAGSAGAATVEIVHESLIGTWPTLRRWLDESHEDSVFLDQLQGAARQWQAKRKERGLLWGGEMVEELQRFLRRYKGELPEASRAFTNAIFDQRARGERRRRKLRVVGGVFVAMLLAAAAVALVVISNAQRAAERNAVAAKQAEGQARRRLREVEEKEQERRRAEARQRAAEKEAAAAAGQVKLTNEELAKKNIELTGALELTNEQRQRAEEAQAHAEANERAARDAEERARRSAEQIEKLLVKERERANRLNEQLGSALVETLR